MRLADIQNPTAEQVRDDMLRRLRNSLESEVASLKSIIKSNQHYDAPINRRRVVAYEARLSNLNRVVDDLDNNVIRVVVYFNT